MTTAREDVRAWAGPAADQITDETADQIASAWDQVYSIYCADEEDPDTLGSAEASTGAAMYILGDTTIAQAAREWQDAQAAALAAQDRLTGVIIAALDDGDTQMSVSAQVGIARTTLARWLAPRR